LDERENLYEDDDFPLTSMGDDDEFSLTSSGEDDEFALTTNRDDDRDFFLTSDDEAEGEPFPSPPSERRPMFERIQPPPSRATEGARRPPIPRPNRLDPSLLNRRRPRGGEVREERRSDGVSPDRRAPRPKKIASRKKKFAAVYIFALVVGIALCLTFFALHFQNIQEIGAQTVPASPAPTPPPTIVVPPDVRNLMAQIIRVDTRPNVLELEVVNLTSGIRHTFNYTEGTEMTNIHGRPMHFEELQIGQLLDIGYDARTDNLLTANQSRRAWERRAQTNLRIDLENDTITAGNDVFSFSHHQTMVLYRGQPFPIAHIQSMNSVTLVGYGNHVWLVQLDAGHGFLQVANAYRVINGHIEIGNYHFLPLFEIGLIQLQEGTHRVVITGQNIETYVTHVEIMQGETFILNLGLTQLRTAHLHVHTTPPDAIIYVNNERMDDNPIQLEFGEYVIRVESYGFIPQEQVINITGTVASITFELVEAVRTGMMHIITLPTNAQIFVNGVFVGHSELFHELPLGVYTVSARLQGYEEREITKTIIAGENSSTLLLTPLQISPWPPATPLPPYGGDPFATPAPPPIGAPIPTPPPLS